MEMEVVPNVVVFVARNRSGVFPTFAQIIYAFQHSLHVVAGIVNQVFQLFNNGGTNIQIVFQIVLHLFEMLIFLVFIVIVNRIEFVFQR